MPPINQQPSSNPEPISINKVPPTNISFQTIPPIPQQPPVQVPTFNGVPIQPKRKSKVGFILFVLIVLALLGAAGYGYYNKLWVFRQAPYDTAKLASGIFTGLSNIKSSNYSLNIDVSSTPKDPDALPFKLEVPTDQAKVDAYNRDLDTVRDVQTITRYLYPPYPASLDELKSPEPISNSHITYTLNPDKKDYKLKVNFETTEAMDYVVKYMGSSYGSFKYGNGAITITKGSPSYISIPDTLPQPQFAGILNMQNYLSYVPAAFKLNATIDGKTNTTDAGNINSDTHVTANTDLGDINVAVDVEFKKIADNFFVYITKLPSFFIDISKLKGNWVKITPNDLASGMGSVFGSIAGDGTDKDKAAKAKEEFKNKLNKVLTIADKDKAFIVQNEPTIEKVNGVQAYRYDLEFNKDTIVTFYSDLVSEFNDASTTEDTLQFQKSTLDYLKSPEFSKAFDYFRKNTTLTVWSDKNGTPIQVQYSVRVVPESKTSAPSTNQVKFTATLTLEDINSPVSIEEPKDALSFEDATILLSGMTKEQYRFSKQLSNIRSIQTALKTYKTYVGKYPDSLNDLLVTAKDLKTRYNVPDEVTNKIYLYGGVNQKLLASIPVDVNTNTPYTYKALGQDNYNLSYQVNLPKYVPGTVPSGIYTYNYDYTSKTGPKIVMVVVNGVNTADAKVFSEEADNQSKLDSDKDGLPDILEDYIGTNKFKADTDKDGHSDKDELLSGSNPLGAGRLTGNMYGSVLY